MSDNLILAPFRKAVNSLNVALKQPKNEFTRDATIQRFEYSFELAWKTLRRHLKMEAGIDEFNIKNIFREAGKIGLINNVEEWFNYHKARNLTSHTYNEETAEEVFLIAKQFMPAVEKLLIQLEAIHGNQPHSS